MMGRMNKISVLIGALAVLMLSVAAVTVTSRVTSAGSPNQVATPTSDCAANQANDATETPSTAADTDQIDQQCGPQDATDGVADSADAADSAPEAADASEPATGADTDAVEQQDGPGSQDAPDVPGAPATP